MYDGLSFIDIIFLALIAVFVVTRFTHTKLPKDKNKQNRTRTEGGLTARKSQTPPKAAELVEEAKKAAVVSLRPRMKKPDPNLKGVDKVRAMDPFFQEKTFLEGAKSAYSMYVESVDERDEGFLEGFLAPRLMDEQLDAWEQLDENDQTERYKLKQIDDIRLLDADVKGRTAFIDVALTALESRYVVKKGAEEAAKPVSGKKEPQENKVIWTLARSVDSDDPNWELVKIQKPS